MIYKHYVIKYNENKEYEKTTILGYTNDIGSAIYLNLIIELYFNGCNNTNHTYKVGFTQI